MPDSPDHTDDANDPGDDRLDQHLRALIADAGSDAPDPPDFRHAATSTKPSTNTGRSPEDRRLTLGIGAGILAIAAALALFFVVPGRKDAAFVVSDTGTTSTPKSTVDTAPPTSLSVPRPVPTTSVVTTGVTPDPTSATVASQPSTTAPTAPTITSLPPGDPAPIDAVDVPGQSVFGIRIFDAVDVDTAVGDVSARIGSPTSDSGWQSMTGQVDCTGSKQYRALWWGDFRMTFERYEGNGEIRDELSEWTVGDPTLSGYVPIGDVPVAIKTNIVTLEGIGLGSTRADVEAVWANINNGGDGRLVVIDRGGALLITLDSGDQVVGLGLGPFDCPTDEIR